MSGSAAEKGCCRGDGRFLQRAAPWWLYHPCKYSVATAIDRGLQLCLFQWNTCPLHPVFSRPVQGMYCGLYLNLFCTPQRVWFSKKVFRKKNCLTIPWNFIERLCCQGTLFLKCILGKNWLETLVCFFPKSYWLFINFVFQIFTEYMSGNWLKIVIYLCKVMYLTRQRC